MRTVVSPFLSFLMQVFFALCVLGGVLGLFTIIRRFLRTRPDLDPSLAWVFCILLTCLVIMGLIGIMYVRSPTRLATDPYLLALARRKPINNVLSGLIILGLSTLMVINTGPQQGSHSLIGIVIGAMQALVGASQMALSRRRESAERMQL